MTFTLNTCNCNCSLFAFRSFMWCCPCVWACCVCWNSAKWRSVWRFWTMCTASASLCLGRWVYGCWCCCSPSVCSIITVEPGAEDTCVSTDRHKDYKTCRSSYNPQVRTCVVVVLHVLHKVAPKLKEEWLCVCISMCRKCVAVDYFGCSTERYSASLHAAQRAGAGAPGGFAVLDLLHR